MNAQRTMSEEPQRGRHTSLASMSRKQLISQVQSLQRQLEGLRKEVVDMRVLEVSNRKVHGKSFVYEIIWGRKIWTNRDNLQAFNCLEMVDELDQRMESEKSQNANPPSKIEKIPTAPRYSTDSIERSLTPDRALNKFSLKGRSRAALPTLTEKKVLQQGSTSAPTKVILDAKRKALPYDSNVTKVGRLPPDQFLKKRKPNFPPMPTTLDDEDTGPKLPKPAFPKVPQEISISSNSSEMDFSGDGADLAENPLAFTPPSWYAKFPDFSHLNFEDSRDPPKQSRSAVKRQVSIATYRTANNPTAFLKKKLKHGHDGLQAATITYE